MNKIMLSTNIYDIDHVKKAIEAYETLCKIKIAKTNNYIICEFTDCIYNNDETIREFENYIIDLMNTDVEL